MHAEAQAATFLSPNHYSAYNIHFFYFILIFYFVSILAKGV